MKMQTKYLIILAIIATLIALTLIFKPNKTQEKVIEKVVYKDSPIVNNLSQKVDTFKAKVVIKKEVLYKYITVVKDTVIRDSIYIFADDALAYQDSIIMCKDTIISSLQSELQFCYDSICFYKASYMVEKTNKKRWIKIGIGSIILNSILILKRS